MMMTNEVMRAIRKAVKEECGRSYRLEMAIHPTGRDMPTLSANAFIWDADSDLVNTAPLSRGGIMGDEDRAGMVLLDLYLYSRTGGDGDSGLLGNAWALLTEIGEVKIVSNSYGLVIGVLSNILHGERIKSERRKQWTAAAERWRKRAGMPATGRRKVPLHIVADWTQDHDDGQDDAVLLREAIAAGYPV